MRPTPKIIWPIYVFFILAVATLLLAVLLFYRANKMGQDGDQQLRVAQSQQVLTERLFTAASTPHLRGEVGPLVDQFDTLQQLKPVTEVSDAWDEFRRSLPFADPLSAEDKSTTPDLAPLLELSRSLRDWMDENSADPAQREAASHLLQLAEVVEVKTYGGAGSATPARGAWLFFDEVLSRLEYDLEEGALQGDQIGTLVTELRSEFRDNNTWFANADAADVRSEEITEAQSQSQSLLKIALDNQIDAAEFAKDRQAFLFQSGLVAALASLVLFFLVSVLLWRLSRQWAGYTQATDQQNQESIMHLLEEISALAEGDLNTRVTVSEGMTGAIADAINYAVSELRRLVSAITSSADRVTVAVEETGSSAQQLAKASSVQSREIQRSATYLSAMAETMEEMSQRSHEAAQIASQSVEKSVGGRQNVEKTFDGMNRIRTHIQLTSSLMKRLGESSEQIGEIVALINEVTSRSRLLALNSAIHSNSESSENHRFSSIADEVQTLSATLKEAAGDIATLVNIIQDDTRAALDSMNLTTAEVMQGSELATQAGDSLQDIETISRRLSVVVDHLSEKTSKQSDVVSQLSSNMGVINDVTRRSAHGMQLSAAALEDLRHMATELRDGVSDFVLPNGAHRAKSDTASASGGPSLKVRAAITTRPLSNAQARKAVAGDSVTTADG